MFFWIPAFAEMNGGPCAMAAVLSRERRVARQKVVCALSRLDPQETERTCVGSAGGWMSFEGPGPDGGALRLTPAVDLESVAAVLGHVEVALVVERYRDRTPEVGLRLG